jgi:cysteine desulfuration protein SufE
MIGNVNPATPLTEKHRQLAAALGLINGSQARFAWLVEQAKSRPALEIALRNENNQLEGCLSKLWVVAEARGGLCFFQADSDSLIVKAIAGLLCDFYSGQPPAAILAHDPVFLKELGISQHLTPNRRNGLAKVWQRIQSFARGRVEGPATSDSPAVNLSGG